MIGDRPVGDGEPVFIVAEAGVNHNGDIETAKKMIAAAAQAGADAVKFQTWRTEAIMIRDAPKAAYQKDGDSHETMFDMEKALELPPDSFAPLKHESESAGLIFLSSPFDEPSVDVLADLDVAAYKVPSGELTNLPLLRHIARKAKPMIISTGMTTLGEVESALAAVTGEGNEEIVLLHCTSCYPTAITADMLALKRPGTGLSPDAVELVVGQVAAEDIAEDALLEWPMLRAGE